MTVLSPVTGISRSSAVADRLKDAIILGVFSAGEQIPSEKSLTQIFNVSPMTVREALTSLRYERIIVTKRGRAGGSFVSDMASTTLSEVVSDDTISEAFETAHHVSAIIGKAAFLAAERASAPQLQSLSSAIERNLELLKENRDPLAISQAASKVYIHLARASQSPRLTGEVISAQIEWIPWGVRSGRETILDPATTVNAQRKMRNLFDGLRSRNGAYARKQVEEYIDLQLSALAPVLSDEISPEEAAHCASSQLEEILLEAQRAVISLAELMPEIGNDVILASECTKLLERYNALSGIGFAANRGSGRDSVEWFVRDSLPGGIPGERVHRKEVDILASGPGDSGYRGFDWFSLPNSINQGTVVGPYVDHLCGMEYTLTISQPSLNSSKNEFFKGIIVADMSAKAIEKILVPCLMRTSKPLIVFHTDGRILTSTDPTKPIGNLVDEADYRIISKVGSFPYMVGTTVNRLV